jgi:hypothetical protein
MSKSKPINRNIAVALENIEEDENVQEVLDNINTENYVVDNEIQSNPVDQYQVQGQEKEMYVSESQYNIPYIGALTNDIKMAAICAVVFILASQIPLEKIVYNYISLENIPFSGVIAKALIAAALFFLISRFI